MYSRDNNHGYHKGGKRYNGGVPSSSHGYNKGGYQDQENSRGYGQQRQNGYYSKQKDGPHRDGPFRDGPHREGPGRDGPYGGKQHRQNNDHRMQFNYVDDRAETPKHSERPYYPKQGMKVQA